MRQADSCCKGNYGGKQFSPDVAKRREIAGGVSLASTQGTTKNGTLFKECRFCDLRYCPAHAVPKQFPFPKIGWMTADPAL